MVTNGVPSNTEQTTATNSGFVEPRDEDVKFGRGLVSRGTRIYRRLVELNRERYQSSATRDEKGKISRSIVAAFLTLGVRFIELDAATNQWRVVIEKKVVEKCSQALREVRGKQKASQSVPPPQPPSPRRPQRKTTRNSVPANAEPVSPDIPVEDPLWDITIAALLEDMQQNEQQFEGNSGKLVSSESLAKAAVEDAMIPPPPPEPRRTVSLGNPQTKPFTPPPQLLRGQSMSLTQLPQQDEQRGSKILYDPPKPLEFTPAAGDRGEIKLDDDVEVLPYSYPEQQQNPSLDGLLGNVDGDDELWKILFDALGLASEDDELLSLLQEDGVDQEDNAVENENKCLSKGSPEQKNRDIFLKGSQEKEIHYAPPPPLVEQQHTRKKDFVQPAPLKDYYVQPAPLVELNTAMPRNERHGASINSTTSDVTMSSFSNLLPNLSTTSGTDVDVKEFHYQPSDTVAHFPRQGHTDGLSSSLGKGPMSTSADRRKQWRGMKPRRAHHSELSVATEEKSDEDDDDECMATSQRTNESLDFLLANGVVEGATRGTSELSLFSVREDTNDDSTRLFSMNNSLTSNLFASHSDHSRRNTLPEQSNFSQRSGVSSMQSISEEDSYIITMSRRRSTSSATSCSSLEPRDLARSAVSRSQRTDGMPEIDMVESRLSLMSVSSKWGWDSIEISVSNRNINQSQNSSSSR